MANPFTGSTTDYKNQPTPFEDEDFASMLEESFKGMGDGKGEL